MNTSHRPRTGLGSAPQIVGSCRIDRDTSARVIRKGADSWCVTVGSWRSSAADEAVACGASQAEATRTMRDLCGDGPDRKPGGTPRNRQGGGSSAPSSGMAGSVAVHDAQAASAWNHAQGAVGQVINLAHRGDCDEAMDAYGEMMMAYGRHQAHAEHAGGVGGLSAMQRDSRRNATGTAVRSINRCRSQAWKAPKGGRRAPW